MTLRHARTRGGSECAGQRNDESQEDIVTESTQTAEPVETGYVPVGDLQVYYETYGEGGTPLLLLHGGLFDIEQQFGALLPGLSARRRVLAVDFQAHGRTNDIDRPLGIPALASDIVAVLSHLGLSKVDVFGSASGARWRSSWRSNVPSWCASSSCRRPRSRATATPRPWPR
jgi:hypothetical protein